MQKKHEIIFQKKMQKKAEMQKKRCKKKQGCVYFSKKVKRFLDGGFTVAFTLCERCVVAPAEWRLTKTGAKLEHANAFFQAIGGGAFALWRKLLTAEFEKVAFFKWSFVENVCKIVL